MPVLAGCVITREPDVTGDSTSVITIALDTMATRSRAPIDSPAAIPTPTVPSIRIPEIPAETVVSLGEIRDSSDVAPTAAELAMLSSELTMPIATVKPEELRDTFNEPRGGGTRTHEALDIMAPRGTPVLSATPGRVLKLHTSNAGGLMVYAADSAERFVLMYAHLDGYAEGLRDGLPLQRGQVLGYVGTTGNAPPGAPHLHFAIAHPRDVNLWWKGVPVDPRPLLQWAGAR